MNLEKTILGGIEYDNSKILDALEIINTNDFAEESNRLIFDTMCNLYDSNEPIDSITLYSKLMNKVPAEYLMSLSAGVNTGANVQHHCKILKEQSIFRLIKSLYDRCKSEDAFETLENAEKLILDIGSNGNTEVNKIDKIINNVTDHLIKIKDGTEKVDGIMSGLYDLDSILHGFKKTDLVVLAARPAMGKTALAMQLAQRSNSLIFSLEMSEEQLIVRAISSELGETVHSINSGHFNFKDYDKAVDKIKGLNLFISDIPGQTLQQIKSTSRKVCHKEDIQMIVVDYLQLMNGTGYSREDIVSKISRGLKGLAKELKVPILALSQLNRAVESRPDKRPLPSDLRESGSIEQDADSILFLYRPEVYNIMQDGDGNSTEGLCEIMVSKNRHGATGTAKVFFEKQYTRFKNLETNITKPSIF